MSQPVACLVFGGGCHWCTEAVFQNVKGVISVIQGYVSQTRNPDHYSEAAMVFFNREQVSMSALILIHLYSHSSTAHHKLRDRYRSQVVCFDPEAQRQVEMYLKKASAEYMKSVITIPTIFHRFRPSDEQLQGYYKKDPEKPFCRRYISPKLHVLKEKFPGLIA
ncbi:peptide-methionine (S)-S-oxide reductase [Robertkochia aurantiaca]|uniref:peptide-methionine (S)-S-oxide reductase n=1 Tax=Robertkochia aurantiaca TaxID=2873700 RepID=UPI001CCE8DC6|nr:peptide-methionine (S)-S-oxide reductase [Robertkochia sp. 3YJGBD-33]